MSFASTPIASRDRLDLHAHGRTIAIRGAFDAIAARHCIAAALALDATQTKPDVRAHGEPNIDILLWANSGEGSHDVDVFERLSSDAWLVLSESDAASRRLAQRQRGRALFFGRSADCEVVASDITFEGGCLRFQVDQQPFCVSAYARSSLKEVLAAVSVARIFALPLARVAGRLAGPMPSDARWHTLQVGQVTIIHDTREATLAAIGEALDMLREHPGSGRRIVCCGQMPDEREHACQAFAEELVSRCGADRLIVCGPKAERIVAAARSAGMPAHEVQHQADDIARQTAEALAPGDVLLVLGGPSEQMSHLVHCIRKFLCVTDTSVLPLAARNVAEPTPITSFIS